MLICC